jgi:TatA/E family protein of Tat protein translocase
MLNIGPQELLLIFVLALLVVGPKRLPELGRSLGRGIRELRKAQDEVRKTISINLDDEPTPAPRRSTRPLPLEDADSPSTTPDGSEATPVSGSDLAAAAGAAAVPPTGAGSSVAPAAAPAESTGVGEISRTLGRTLAELRRAREEIQRSFRVDLDPSPASSPRRPVVRSAAPSSETNGAPAAGRADATTEGRETTPAPAPALDEIRAPADVRPEGAASDGEPPTMGVDHDETAERPG